MNSINMITMILTVILGIMVMLLLVLGILYIKSKGKKKDDKNDEIIAGTGNKKGKGTKSYSTESVFDFMEFDKIEDNMIITQNAYSLNARAIQTTDEMMTIINGIKR